MTRINVGILPKHLTNKHLLAEHREIKRIPNCIKKGRFSLDGQPQQFTLGKGHVKFFYTRLNYLLDRYKDLHKECLKRNFNVQDYSDAWNDVPLEFMGDYQPTKQDICLIEQRINERNALQ